MRRSPWPNGTRKNQPNGEHECSRTALEAKAHSPSLELGETQDNNLILIATTKPLAHGAIEYKADLYQEQNIGTPLEGYVDVCSTNMNVPATAVPPTLTSFYCDNLAHHDYKIKCDFATHSLPTKMTVVMTDRSQSANPILLTLNSSDRSDEKVSLGPSVSLQP